jgi:hypothetical protein
MTCMTWTCCWTDHSNGCPRHDVPMEIRKKSSDSYKDCLAWVCADHAAFVQRGYEKPKELHELEHTARILFKWAQEDKARA